MKIAKALQNVIDSFQALPGIGPKTAQRMGYYLLHVPQIQLENFAESLTDLKKKTLLCSVCKNVAEINPCDICTAPNRDRSKILVVEEPLDVVAFEKTGRYQGDYHVLHGKISPLENIGPEEIFTQELLQRVKKGNIAEVIIATNPTMEGEATAMYLNKEIKKVNDGVRVTRLGMGIPTGADLEYADEATLTQAIEGRREV